VDIKLQYQILCNSRNFGELASNDSDAIEYATHLLTHSSNKGPSQIFVFTDGWSSVTSKTRYMIKQAEEKGVHVLGVGLGIQEKDSGLPKNYNSWITCLTPFSLPEALKRWNSGEEFFQKKEVDYWEIEESNSETGFEDIWQKHKNVFQQLHEELEAERSFYIDQETEKGGNFSIDVCFVMDTTGSMQPWINAAKLKIQDIAKQIQSEISTKFSQNAKLRISFVSYKDHHDGVNRLSGVNFESYDPKITPNPIDKVLKKIANTEAFGGGGDGPEDLTGGVHMALQYDWKSNVKFIVLVADSACHGHQYNGIKPGHGDSYPKGDPYGLKPEDLLEKMKSKSIHLMFIKITNDTDFMITKFREFYDDTRDPIMFKIKEIEFTGKVSVDTFFKEEISKNIMNKLIEDFM
jgi:hypothetical protein